MNSWQDTRPELMDGPVPAGETASTPLRQALGRTRRWLLDRQDPHGFWCAELEGDTILESETILLWAFLGQEHTERARRAAQYLLEKQLPDGGWAMYPGGRLDISGSVKAYFALKLTGHDPSAESMQRARRAILAHGGADAVNSFTRFYLALLGQISYEHCPAVPPEVVLLPKWFPINLYAMSSWSRGMVAPLSIASALRPVRAVEPRRGIRELFLREPAHWPILRCPGLKQNAGLWGWDRFFRTADRLWKWAQRRGFLPLRKTALAAAEKWILDRFPKSDGLGAIYPPIVWCIVALKALGYADDSPELAYNYRQLDDLVIDEPNLNTLRIQPCKSPVWDTAITMRALFDAGLSAEHPAQARAAAWLVDKEVAAPGDWARTVRAQPGGWYFEHNNEFYPDCDDTAMVLMALQQGFGKLTRAQDAPVEGLALLWDATCPLRDVAGKLAALHSRAGAIERGTDWLLAMQNRDGGWGAFDRNNDRQFLCHVPFADHNAMIDPSTPDLTARVLEALGQLGYRQAHAAVARGDCPDFRGAKGTVLGEKAFRRENGTVPFARQAAVERAVAYLRRTQEPDGSWYGRWGVNYIYGTWQTLTGLRAVGVAADDPAVLAGVNWLLAHQQPDGAWGESADSYEDPRLRGQGPPTASQTAWAVLGLLAAGRQGDRAVRRGVDWLLRTQLADGSWHEPEFTGTGFPRVFYLRYHDYCIYFPLMALARFAVLNHPQEPLCDSPSR